MSDNLGAGTGDFLTNNLAPKFGVWMSSLGGKFLGTGFKTGFMKTLLLLLLLWKVVLNFGETGEGVKFNLKH